MELLLKFLIFPLVVAGITFLFSFSQAWFLNWTSYKQDFNKKLIDRKLDAYKSVESIVGHLQILHETDSDSFCYSVFSDGSDRYNDFINLFGQSAINSHWINKDTMQGIVDFKYKLSQWGFDNEDISKSDMVKLAIKHHEDISKIKISIRKAMNQDIKNAYKNKISNTLVD
jgi:hypothetical protein